jgi:hypothetical protein
MMERAFDPRSGAVLGSGDPCATAACEPRAYHQGNMRPDVIIAGAT